MNTSLLWTVFIVSSPYIFSKFNLFNMDTSCLYFRQFALSLGKESPYIFSKFNLLNVDLLLILTHSMAPSVSILTEFDCIYIHVQFAFYAG